METDTTRLEFLKGDIAPIEEEINILEEEINISKTAGLPKAQP